MLDIDEAVLICKPKQQRIRLARRAGIQCRRLKYTNSINFKAGYISRLEEEHIADYNLSGLSTRSFEQLIQAIAAKAIGPNIVVFGDGPDGGREATFEGSVPYPSSGHSWSGYGVVQAKFRQRTQDPQRDGEWALKQLRDELEKFVDSERNLRKPDYYIFATNVILTPVQGSGFKDKADALIKEYKDRLGLKEYDIWDYDKIRIFLDDYEGIRRAYAAWITPGDVLAQVIEWLVPQQPNFERTITNFLQKELLADQYAKLEQAGHTVEDRIPLASVFVDLPVAHERANEPPDEQNDADLLPQGFVAEALDVALERLDPQSLNSLATQRVMRLKSTNHEPGRFVLVGGPGQGKTTVGQFICQLFRAAIIKEKQSSLSREARQALQQIETQCHHEGIALPTARRFPIRIVLSDFAAALASPEASHINTLLSYIVDRIRRRTDQTVSVEDFRNWLSAYPWVLILDGLDEVPASSNHDAVLSAVNDFWIDAAGSNADVLVIATTRPQGYNQDFAPDVYQHRWLMPLSTARALHYADRLVDIRYPNDQDRKEKVLQRLQRATNAPATARLMHSPLQVTIMTTLVDQMGQPPQERWSLFKEYYNVIYRRELERDIPAATILRDYKENIDIIHRHVDLLLQVESERSGRTDAKLSTDQFAAVVEARLRVEGFADDELAALRKQIIDAATTRLVFLVSVEADEVGFEIRSLQEFMAAEGLMDGTDNEVQDRLREIAPIINWRNVFLFAAGKCFAERQYLRNTVQAICVQLNDDPADGVAQATLAGSQLALDLLEDGPARRQPNFARSLTRLALRLLDLPPAADQLRLADLYEPQLEQVYREELERRVVTGNTEQTFGAWACLVPLIEAGVPWAEELGDSRWKAKSSNQALLLQQLIKQHKEGVWSTRKLIEVFPYCSVPELSDEGLIFLETVDASKLSQPAWFRAAVKAVGSGRDFRTDVPVRFENLNETVFELFLHMIGGGKSHWLTPLKDMPSAHPAWQPLIAAARFMEEPSQSSLAYALRAIKQGFDYEAVRWAAYRTPWPLAACLATATDEDKLDKLAARSEAGELGNVTDWEVAEERWQQTGVVVKDFDCTIDEHWPFNQSIAQEGFPFAASGAMVGGDMDRNTLLQQLLDIYARNESSNLRSKVAEWILFVASAFRLYTSNDHSTISLPLEQLRKLFDDAVSSRWIIDGLGALLPEDIINSDWVDLLDEVGKSAKIGWRANNRLAQVSEHIFYSQPTRVGILRLLSLLALRGARFSIPTMLVDPAQLSDPMFREAAVIVRVAQGFEHQQEAEVMANYVAELMRTQPNLVIDMLSATREHRVTSLYNDHFLLELLKQTLNMQWKIVDQIINDLNDCLRRRTSQLDDSGVWSQLGLPTGLNNI